MKAPQERWLREDLQRNRRPCTLAYAHHPRFSSGINGSSENLAPLWQALYEYGVDVYLAGHDHHYERFAPQRPDGVSDPERGMREFVVGTGGRSITPFRTILPNSEVQDTTSFGVLVLRLGPTGYQWKFLADGRACRSRTAAPARATDAADARAPSTPGSSPSWDAPTSGKSTLVNRLVGQKVAIVSDKPQTTRNRILAVVNRPEGQIVLFDTPGIHKPMHRMNKRMVDTAVKSLGQVELAVWVIDVTEPYGPGDRYVREVLKKSGQARHPRHQQDRPRAQAEDPVRDRPVPHTPRLRRGRAHLRPRRRERGRAGLAAPQAPSRRASASTRRTSSPTCPSASSWPRWCASRSCA